MDRRVCDCDAGAGVWGIDFLAIAESRLILLAGEFAVGRLGAAAGDA